jgi:hypothetical protein
MLIMYGRNAPVAPLLAVATALGSLSCTSIETDATGLDVLPMVQLEQELRIGSPNDPEVGFSRIGAVEVDRDGQVYVFEHVDQHIRVYGSDGQLVRTIGRKGTGPGEFTFSASIAIVGDTVIAMGGRQLGGCRVAFTLFDRNGNMLSTAVAEGVRMALQGSNVGVIRPSVARDDGTFIGRMSCYTGGTAPNAGTVGPNDTLRIPRLVFNLLGEPIDTVGWDLRFPPAPRVRTDTAFILCLRHI